MLGVCLGYDNNNYGTMLQAYANLVAIEDMGVPYEIIQYRKKYTPWFVAKSLPRFLNPILMYEKKLVAQKRLHLRRNRAFAENSAVKDNAFTLFKKEHFKVFSPVYYGYDELCRQAQKYEACLVGSDQLWSPSGLPTNFYNLRFVPDHVRKISYAASFGVSAIPTYQRGRTKAFLERIEYLSVREDSAREIVRQLTGRRAEIVVDPTLLLTAEDWAKHIPPVRPCREPYLFAYFLGENPAHRAEVTGLARRLGIKLVALRHMDQFVPADEGFGDEAPYDVGPAEFVNLIRHARYVCTDSFHGTVFSTLHHRQFVVFNRYGGAGGGNSRNSRIDSICGNLGLQARRFDAGVSLAEKIAAPIDYGAVDEKIGRLRGHSLEFLREALSVVPQPQAPN